MPFLPNEQSADKLLKKLGIHLSQQFPTSELRSFGWFQYCTHDHPRTLIATELAAHAFLYLSFDANGAWRRNPKVITAISAFMSQYYPSLKQEDLVRLKHLIDTKPLNPQAISDWFHLVYPPERSRE